MVARTCAIGLGDCGCNIAASVGNRFGVEDRAAIDFQFWNTNWPSLRNLYAQYPFLMPGGFDNMIILGKDDPDLAGGGAGDDPAAGLKAFELSKSVIIDRLQAKNYQEFWVFWGGGKGTGGGTAYPVVKMLREELQKITFSYGILPAPDIQIDEDRLDDSLKVFRDFQDSGFLTAQLLNASLFKSEELYKLPLVEAYDKANEILAQAISSVMRFTSNPLSTDLNDFRKNVYPGSHMMINRVCIKKGWTVDEVIRGISKCASNRWYDIDLKEIRAALIIVEGAYTMELEQVIGTQFRNEVRRMRGLELKAELKNYRQYVASYPSTDGNLYITAMFVDRRKESISIPRVEHGHTFELPEIASAQDSPNLQPEQKRVGPTPINVNSRVASGQTSETIVVAKQATTLLEPSGSIASSSPDIPEALAQFPIFNGTDFSNQSPRQSNPEPFPTVELTTAPLPTSTNGHAASVQKKLASIKVDEKVEFSTLREMIKEASLNNSYARAQLQAEPSPEFKAKVAEGKTGNSIIECLDILKQYHNLLGQAWKEFCLKELQEKLVLGDFDIVNPDGKTISLVKEIPIVDMQKMLNWDLDDEVKEEICRRMRVEGIFGFDILKGFAIRKKKVEKKKTDGFAKRVSNWFASLNS